MRYFFDTEFMESAGHLELISLGIVADDGRTYYAQSCEFDARLANRWVREHVFPHLERCPGGNTHVSHGYGAHHPDVKCPWRQRTQMRDEIVALVGTTTPEFWAYYAAYDWVLFCGLFGAMVDLPAGWPMLAYDLRQWLNQRGLSHVKQPDTMPHHALSDAGWVAETYRRYADA